MKTNFIRKHSFLSPFDVTRDYRSLHSRTNIVFLFFRRLSKFYVLIFCEILYWKKSFLHTFRGKTVCLPTTFKERNLAIITTNTLHLCGPTFGIYTLEMFCLCDFCSLIMLTHFKSYIYEKGMGRWVTCFGKEESACGWDGCFLCR